MSMDEKNLAGSNRPSYRLLKTILIILFVVTWSFVFVLALDVVSFFGRTQYVWMPNISFVINHSKNNGQNNGQNDGQNDGQNITPGKPVIYLYPTHTQDVTVQLHYQGTLAATYPAYNATISGWDVTASPDGTLTNHADGKQYSYLFWEGNPTHTKYNLSTGFVVKGSDTARFLQTTLAHMGLTPREYNELIVYWYPKMKDNPYNLIHFAGKSYTDIAPLTITPAPDSLLRVFMVYQPLQKPIVVQPQTITPFQRHGFTVVEWGGTEVE